VANEDLAGQPDVKNSLDHDIYLLKGVNVSN
jgi:hypothetical protein